MWWTNKKKFAYGKTKYFCTMNIFFLKNPEKGKYVTLDMILLKMFVEYSETLHEPVSAVLLFSTYDPFAPPLIHRPVKYRFSPGVYLY